AAPLITVGGWPAASGAVLGALLLSGFLALRRDMGETRGRDEATDKTGRDAHVRVPSVPLRTRSR
ncbi:hypothetical protein ACFC18_49000, partial [Streptomyces sp. NPDC056121]